MAKAKKKSEKPADAGLVPFSEIVASIQGLPTKCKDHPRYSGKQAPRSTPKNPGGCAVCWKYYLALMEQCESYPELALAVAKGKGGAPAAWGSPAELAQAGHDYLLWCHENKKHPTKSGMCVFTGTYLELWAKYRRGERDRVGVEPTYSAVLKELDAIFIGVQEQRLLDSKSGATNLIAWMNNNAGWSQGDGQKVAIGIKIDMVDYSGDRRWTKDAIKVEELPVDSASSSGDSPVED